MTYEAIDPHKRQSLGRYSTLTAGELRSALDRSEHAFLSWRRTTLEELSVSTTTVGVA